MESGRKKVIVISIVLIILIAFFAVALNLDKWIGYESGGGFFSALDIQKKMQTVYINNVAYRQNPDIKTFLVIGLDSFGEIVEEGSYYNTEQADVLFLISVNEKDRSCSCLQINRDTMMEVDQLGLGGVKYGTHVEQVALSHTYGDGGSISCMNTVSAISRFLYGLRIDYYVAITMDGVVELVNCVGGVSITLEDDMTSINPEWTEGATVELLGDDALQYVRARSEMKDDTNIARMRRHRSFLEEVIRSLDEKSHDAGFVTDTVNRVNPYMVTNMSQTRWNSLFQAVMHYERGEILTPEGTNTVGTQYMEFYADQEKLAKLAAELYYDKLD